MSLIKEKNNSVGNLYQVELENNKIYNIFTKAGNYRGGKIYSQDKSFTLLSGTVEVTTFENDKDIKNVYGKGSIINIKADIPNIFYFPEDTEMLEWFPKDTKTQKYERYYNIKK